MRLITLTAKFSCVYLGLLTVFGLIFLFGLASKVFAETPAFTSSTNSNYSFYNDAPPHVSHEITLTSQRENIYPLNYSFDLDLNNVAEFTARMSELSLETLDTTVYLPVPDAASYNSVTTFSVDFQPINSLRTKGLLKVISIPILNSSDDIQVTQQKITVNIPFSWGKMQLSSLMPNIRLNQAETENSDYRVLSFTIDPLNSATQLQLVFGPRQIYNIDLTYHLKNVHSEEITTEVAFPPEFRDLQRVFIKSISPEPEEIRLDVDGNILGTYKLLPGEEVDVRLIGQVMLSLESGSTGRDQVLKDQERYIMPDKYWESNAQEIQKLAAELKTPEAIYNYVTRYFSYSEEKVRAGLLERIGALDALYAQFNGEDNAACMEFTDITISLMRAAGIPAREVDGYAYLEEDETLIRPTVSDVLHAWVQYWDDVEGWVNIDPTWGASTGRDYFHQFDLDHIIFVLKGVSSTYPYPAGSYRSEDQQQQDVKVALAEVDEPIYPSFDEWLSKLNHQELNIWQRLWNWLTSIFR